MQNGLGVTPAINYNPPTTSSVYTQNAVLQLQANREFIAEETVAYVSGFTYNTATCYRDTGLVVDSIAFDLLYGGTSQSVFAGLQYSIPYQFNPSVTRFLAIGAIGTVLTSRGIPTKLNKYTQ